MVEISKSGSGEGLGWATGRGYSTSATPLLRSCFSAVDRESDAVACRPVVQMQAVCRRVFQIEFRMPWNVYRLPGRV